MQVALVMFTQSGERRKFAIEGETAIVGRTGECTIQIQLGVISRRHCELRIKGDEVMVRDLGSSNGTFVNDERVQEKVLEAGDRLMVGPVIFTLVIDGKPEEITPVKTILNQKGKKKTKSKGGSKKKVDALPAPKPVSAGSSVGSVDLGSVDKGSVDLHDSTGPLDILDEEEEGAEHNPLAALEELAKQQKR